MRHLDRNPVSSLLICIFPPSSSFHNEANVSGAEAKGQEEGKEETKAGQGLKGDLDNNKGQPTLLYNEVFPGYKQLFLWHLLILD